ncbi:unnamed protein product [Paramecium pentaurelia]|uniref:Uncharacterized protein n=1 Tax=Paramecium pentaurelia TaxID=43138 RepID=A0A8S1SJT5_9CILI|nr:unnamed protein product [Paramecium pentaurelia]
MNLSKFYSHNNQLNRKRKKQKSPKDTSMDTPPIKRSVTYNSDSDLISKIVNTENLVDLIEKIQKQKQDPYIKNEPPQTLTLPPIINQIERQHNITQRNQKKKQEKEYIPFTYPINPKKIAYYQENNLYGKFIEPTEYKKINYESIKTIETAISEQLASESKLKRSMTERKEEAHKNKFKLIQSSTEDNLENEKIIKNYTLSKVDYENLDSLYSKQGKMNKIIKNALKIKSQSRDPANASKSVLSERIQLQLELKKQYEQSLDLALQGYIVYDDKQFEKKQANWSSLLQRLTQKQYTNRNVKQQSIHQRKQLYVNKTLDIQDKCSEILYE